MKSEIKHVIYINQKKVKFIKDKNLQYFKGILSTSYFFSHTKMKDIDHLRAGLPWVSNTTVN